MGVSSRFAYPSRQRVGTLVPVPHGQTNKLLSPTRLMRTEAADRICSQSLSPGSRSTTQRVV